MEKINMMKWVDDAIAAEKKQGFLVLSFPAIQKMGISVKELVQSSDLQAQIPGSVYCRTLPQVTDYLRSIAGPGDVILTVGAGDIFRAGDALLQLPRK